LIRYPNLVIAGLDDGMETSVRSGTLVTFTCAFNRQEQRLIGNNSRRVDTAIECELAAGAVTSLAGEKLPLPDVAAWHQIINSA
jgi:hypothetical protein